MESIKRCSQLIEATLISLIKIIKNQLNRKYESDDGHTVHSSIDKEKKVIWNQNVFTVWWCFIHHLNVQSLHLLLGLAFSRSMLSNKSHFKRLMGRKGYFCVCEHVHLWTAADPSPSTYSRYQSAAVYLRSATESSLLATTSVNTQVKRRQLDSTQNRQQVAP